MDRRKNVEPNDKVDLKTEVGMEPTSGLLTSYILGIEPTNLSYLDDSLTKRGIVGADLFSKVEDMLIHLGKEIDIIIEDNTESEAVNKIKSLMETISIKRGRQK